jgi:hypothetical protein
MAAAHSGYITLRCGSCGNNAFMRAVNGCDRSLEAPVETIPLNETLFEYYNCPSKFIPNSLNDFMSMYQFGLDFGGIGLYKQLSNKFIEATQFYKARLNHFKGVVNA